ncbi:MAG: glycosyltransferase family 9 protein [Deltaproteobacteria bacterium]|nr:glycosyltransferase family 9 protein [Deltaproteobacteria bacterium]
MTLNRGGGKKILIINLARMGDLLQMTPFLKGFCRERPGVRITLLVLKEFYDVCKGFPCVESVETFDGDGYISRLEDPGCSLVENFKTIQDLVEDLRNRGFDTVINLTFSRLSALLTYLLMVEDVRGITIDDHGNRLVKNPWINHFYNMVTKREINLFNYVDFIRKAGGSDSPSSMHVDISEADQRFAGAFYARRSVSDEDFVVGFQPGASKESRRWPTRSFGDLGGALIEDGAKILLFGTAAEKELGEGIGRCLCCAQDRREGHLFDMTGKTSVGQLAALIKRCDLLVTGDTGTMHVATAVGTRVVALFFGPAFYPETGPYGEDHLVIQTDLPCAPCGHDVRCKNPRCRESIKVSHVLQVIRMIREGFPEREVQVKDGPEWAGISLYRGVFDEEGMLEFRPVIRRPLAPMDLIRQVYREMWKIVLDGRPGKIDPARVGEKVKSLFALDGVRLNLDRESEIFERVAGLAREGSEISRKLVRWAGDVREHLASIKKAGDVIHRIDEEIELQGMAHPACHPLTYMFRQGKENLEEGDLGLLSRKTLGLYATLLREAVLMRSGLQETLACLKGPPLGKETGDGSF